MSARKNYEVTLVAQSVVVVLDAEDESDAIDIAVEEARFPGSTIYQTRARLITDERDLETSKRHADRVAKP